MTLWEQQVAKIVVEFPKFKVKDFKESWFFRLLMKLGWRMGGFTMFNTVYLETSQIGTDRGAQTLHHEVVHVRDAHKFFGLQQISYFILPIGPSFKAIWEWRAYREDLRWVREHTVPGDYRVYLEDWTSKWIADQFCGAGYLWMWPFRKTVLGWCKEFLVTLPQ